MHELTAYQIALASRGLSVLKKWGIVYFALQPRVGKTATSLETCRLYGAESVLFITKKGAIGSINEDYHKFNYDEEFSLTVINHESAHKAKGTYDVVIVDESHCLGSFPKPSRRAKLIKEIVGSTPMILLSGTPSPESYSQLYHQFWISKHSPFKQWERFYDWAKAGFVIIRPVQISGYKFNDYSCAVKEKIDPYVKKLFISFTQEEAKFAVHKLDDEIVRVNINPEVYKLIDYLKQNRIFRFKDGQEVVCDTAVKLQNKIHQICSGTVITETGPKIFDRSKIQWIKSDCRGKKIAIFYLFDAEGTVIKEAFPNWTSDPIEFRDDDSLTFVSQFQSGSRGIDLSSADEILFYNIHFSSELYQQARQRGQSRTHDVQTKIRWIFSDRGIEHNVYDAVVGKQNYTLSYFRRDFL